MSLVFQFAKSLLSQKLRDRFRTHANLDKLAEVVPASILPAEAGGQVPMSVMIDEWKAVLEARRESILSLDRVEYSIENMEAAESTSSKSKTTSTKTSSKKSKQKEGGKNSNHQEQVIDVMSSVCKLDISTWVRSK